MNPRNRIFVILGVLFLISLGWYFFSTKRSDDLQLIGTVDANEVIVSSRIPGRIEALKVDEGDTVQTGQLIATIQSDDLAAARNAAEATATSQRYLLQQAKDTERQLGGSTSSQVVNAEAQMHAAQASLVQAQAQLEHQNADTSRTVMLAGQGVASQQSRDEAVTSLDAARAAVDTAKQNVAAAAAALKVAEANTAQAQAQGKAVAATHSEMKNAQALLNQAQVQLGYAQIVSPISGKVNVRAARQGEVVSAGTPIVTITDLTQTWIYAPLPETQADSVQLGDSLRVVMPSGASLQGKVIAKSAEADFATQRDVSRRKRDIETVRLKLLIDNPAHALRTGNARGSLCPEGQAGDAMNAEGPRAAISVENIVKRYGDFVAVAGITFEVAEGEIFGLLGPNGAGKSTLIRMMTTLTPATEGRAIIAGHDVAREPDAVRRTIGVIPQALTSDIDLTVEENLSIYAKLYEVPKAERERNIDDLLKAVDLLKWRNAQTKTLSGGMRRRLEIARGLVHNPRIFFLDEPTTGLDPVSRVAVWEMLNQLKATRHLTMLITTHYMDEADRLCDRIAIVDHGKLVALDTPMALKASVPGTNVVEVQFTKESPEWPEQLHHLAGVTSVEPQSAGMYRLLTSNGSLTTTQLVEMTVSSGDTIKSLNVQNTTLDDVFVHYTGRQLRDEQVKAVGFIMPPRPGMQP